MALRTTPMMGLPQSPSFRYKQLNPAYQSDPRRILGQSLMTQGSSSAPVRTPLQGLGRLSSALVGAYLQKGAMDRQVAREDELTNNLTNMLPEGATNNQRQLMKMYPEMFAQSLMKGTTSTSLENMGGNLRAVKTTTTGPFGNQSETIGNLTQLTAKKPVEMVTVYKPDDYNVVKAFPKGSAELTTATENGEFVAGSPPKAQAGFEYGPGNKLILQQGGSPAFTRVKEYIKEPVNIANKLQVAKQAYKESLVLAEKGDGLSDTALIYKFFTALEPGGRVTDGEARMTNNAASYGQQLSNQLSKAIESRVFNDETRKELITVMKNVVSAQQNNLNTLFTDKEFNSRIKELGFETKKLFPFYNSYFETLPTFKGSLNNSNVGGDINIGNVGTGNQISTVIKNSSNNDLINSLVNN